MKWQVGIENDKIIQLIELVYDKKGELARKHKDNLQNRITEAKNKLKCLNVDLTIYHKHISLYLIEQNDSLWQQLVSCQMTFNEYQEIIIKPLKQEADDDKLLKAAQLKSKLIEDSDKILEKIEVYLNKIFDKDKGVIDFVKTKPITPESISEMFNTKH